MKQQLTRLVVRNFKRFLDVDIELGNPVVFGGPNNRGKSTALQALALWDAGLRRWLEKRGGKETPAQRPGVTINRKDLSSIPVPDAALLWRDLRVREGTRNGDKPQTRNVRIEVLLEGVREGRPWACGLEFDYANEESFYCRPLRLGEGGKERMVVPEEVEGLRFAFLPPMSGLSDREFVKQAGEIDFLIGQGRTADVLRNLCFHLRMIGDGRWERVRARMGELFGVRLGDPEFVQERGEIVMRYLEPTGVRLELSSAGRGLQQTLLLLTFMGLHPGSVLLLDEPDAHLEILRQREIYGALSRAAVSEGSQIVVATHSEIVLNEAADRDVVVSFVGRPRRIDDRSRPQVMKALKDVGFDQYYQAEQKGWVLYLEGSTDLALLAELARTLGHAGAAALSRAFARYVANDVRSAQHHFHALRHAKPDLVGFALFDRLEREVPRDEYLAMRQWRRREIENYVCQRDTLVAWARAQADDRMGALFAEGWARTMDACIGEVAAALAVLRRPTPWSADVKASDDFLDPLFEKFFERVGLPNLMRKSDYHQLARFVRPEHIDPEVAQVLDAIVETASRARPVRDDGGDP